jgi:hypothetical protein
MKNLFFTAFVVGLLALGVSAQGVRNPPSSSSDNPQPAQTTAKPSPAPQSFQAQYGGGMFGYTEKVKGTLNFDDLNQRLVFRNKEGKEMFALPYRSLLVVEGTSRSYTPTGATVASVIPLPGAGLFGFIKSKHRYLTLMFDDPDSDVRGGTSFKVANKDLLLSAIYTLGEKAELKQRGDAFYRPREVQKPVL